MGPICYNCHGPHGPKIVEAFAEGAGGEVRDIWHYDQDSDRPAVVWGILRGTLEAMRYWNNIGRPYIYIDHGYFIRGHYDGHYRCTWNNFQQTSVIEAHPARWQSYGIHIKPWRKDGAKIIVCPPSEYIKAAFDQDGWLFKTLKTLKAHTDREIVIRHKSGSETKPLQLALGDCHALVTYNSNVAVEALIEGVPVFCDPVSACLPVGRTELDKIERPFYGQNRGAWAVSLAWCQFTLAEMRDGTAWLAMAQKMP